MKQFTLADLLPVVLAGNVVERGGITRYEAGTRSHPEGHHVVSSGDRPLQSAWMPVRPAT